MDFKDGEFKTTNLLRQVLRTSTENLIRQTNNRRLLCSLKLRFVVFEPFVFHKTRSPDHWPATQNTDSHNLTSLKQRIYHLYVMYLDVLNWRIHKEFSLSHGAEHLHLRTQKLKHSQWKHLDACTSIRIQTTEFIHGKKKQFGNSHAFVAIIQYAVYSHAKTFSFTFVVWKNVKTFVFISTSYGFCNFFCFKLNNFRWFDTVCTLNW